MNAILCEFTPEAPECEPLVYKRLNGFTGMMRDNGYWSLFGPPDVYADFLANYVCNEEIWQGKSCANLSVFPALLEWVTTSLRELDFISQNGLKGTVGRFDPDFANGGWYKERTVFDFSSIEVPMRSLFLAGDNTCPLEGLVNSNKAVLESIPSHSMSVEMNFTDLKHFTIVGDNDPIMRNVRHGLLDVNAGEELAADCSAINFNDWN